VSGPDDVPANVPVDAVAPATRGRTRAARKPNDDTVPHLTRTAGGWRFQMRVPSRLADDFRLAGLAPIIRGSLGPRGRGEARRLARQCAASCDAVFALAITQKENVAMVGDPSNNQPNELVHQVVDACQNVIKNAVAQPKTAIHLAHKLAGSLSTLQLVQSEVAKGKAGAVTIIQHAEELTRGALTDVLKHASNPTNALDAVELGLHLCFGDWGGVHQIEPIDTGAMVELANAIAARAGRRLSYVHMPVPIARNDSAYFEPLRRLALTPKSISGWCISRTGSKAHAKEYRRREST
jgi:hypothetical protein